MILNPKFVAHSVNVDYKLKFCLKERIIAPFSGGKFGISLNGAYCLSNKPKYTTVFIFDLDDVLRYVQPAIYFPLKHYTWYHLEGYSVTWTNLAWEMELCGLKKMSLSLCKEVYVPKTRKAQTRKLKEMGFNVIHEIPSTGLLKWAMRFIKLHGDLGRRPKLAEEYNKAVCQLFHDSYEKVKSEAIEKIFKQEIDRLGEKCRICKSFEAKFDGKIFKKKCLQGIKKSPDWNESCDEWMLKRDLFFFDNYICNLMNGGGAGC